jgi:uncharacterized protein YfiM (DUF2279 family)
MTLGILVLTAAAVVPPDTVPGPLPSLLVPPAARVAPAVHWAPRGDRLFGEDKWKHFFTSFLAASLAGSAARLGGMDARASAAVGAGAAVALGVAKEVADLRSPTGSASLLDLGWDAAGAAAAYAVGVRVQ